MANRFFVSSIEVGASLELDKTQAHHVANVMRFEPGQQIHLFDGSGKEYLAEIAEVSRKRVSVTVLSESEPHAQIERKIHLYVALPKGDRQKFLVEKLVELGAESLTPLKTTRGVSVANEKVIQRMEKQVIEACKQCGRNRLMGIHPSIGLEAIPTSQDSPFLIAHPRRDLHLNQFNQAEITEVHVAIGPEGGFTDEEVALALENGWTSVNFGPSILRIETAAVCAASILGVGWTK